MAALVEIKDMFEALVNVWMCKSPDLILCGKLLNELKVLFTNLTFLPTSNITKEQEEELTISRSVLEIGVLWSIAVKDIPSFKRYMAQLKCYYFDYSKSPPKHKYELLGLNLLCLLSENKIADFHLELELLPLNIIQSNEYIRYALSLEQCLMEGSYNKIFLAKQNVPSENYNFFIDILFHTIRDKIATSIEKAYEKISVVDAAKRLDFENTFLMCSYGSTRGWTLGPDNYYYFRVNEDEVESTFQSKELADQVLGYAKELEKII